jgi:hypothetical protein
MTIYPRIRFIPVAWREVLGEVLGEGRKRSICYFVPKLTGEREIVREQDKKTKNVHAAA